MDELTDQPTSVNRYLSLLVDAPSDCDIQDIRREWLDQFKPWNSDLGPSFGYTKQPIWARLLVKSALETPVDLRFEILNPELENVELHAFNSAGNLIYKQVLLSSQNTQNEVQRFRRFPLLSVNQLEPEQTTEMLLRIETSSSTWLACQIMERRQHGSHAVRRLILDQPFIWFSAFAAFSSLISAWTFRSRLFLYHSLFAASYFFYYVASNGYVRNFWSDANDWIIPKLVITTSLLLLVPLVYFTRQYFQNSISIDRRLQTTTTYFLWLQLAIIPICILLPLNTAHYVVHAVSCVTTLWITIMILFLVRPPFQWSNAYVVGGWLCFAPASILMQLQLLGMIPILIQPNLLEMTTMIPVVSLFYAATSERTREIEQIKLSLAQAKEAESKARLSELRYQINPHFLFNTLTSIDALSRTEPLKVRGLIERLAKFLRPRLEPTDSPLVPLSTELSTVRAYLEIEQMRFGNDLQLKLDIPQEVESSEVPDGILQPLVENAIKHRPKNQEKIEIRIAAQLENEKLLVTLANRGTLDSEDTKTKSRSGIGLENIRQRLTCYYGKAATVVLEQNGDWVRCCLTIPRQ